jgi:hypothetical protein
MAVCQVISRLTNLVNPAQHARMDEAARDKQSDGKLTSLLQPAQHA